MSHLRHCEYCAISRDAALDYGSDPVHGRHALVEQIDSGQLDCGSVSDGPLRDATLLNEYAMLLSTAELRQQRRFYFEHDRRRYLVTRALVRTVLSKYAAYRPRTVAVRDESLRSSGSCERGCRGQADRVQSLAHRWADRTRRHTRWQYRRGRRERERRPSSRGHRRPLLRAGGSGCLARAALERAAAEVLRVLDAEGVVHQGAGMGLSIPLDRFAFHLEDARRIGLTLDPVLGDSADRWRFWQVQLGHGHLGAVCVDDGQDRQRRVEPVIRRMYLARIGQGSRLAMNHEGLS